MRMADTLRVFILVRRTGHAAGVARTLKKI